MDSVLQPLIHWITTNVNHLGYTGIIIMMAMESACIPLPSEVIMPLGGLLVHGNPGLYNVWMMGFAGTLGELCGSTVAYFVGKSGGRKIVERYGKYILIRHKDLDKADAWFKKHGEAAVMFGRWMPVVRTFISFPAGVSRMRYGRFLVYTIIGSLPWCIGLAWVGKALGPKWDQVLKPLFHKAQLAVVLVLVVLVALYIYHHIRGGKEATED